ncbi:MAG: HAD family hydrolase [Clostridia bacterium]|nr:HAD family hydrolase [Clostridia bacterium]
MHKGIIFDLDGTLLQTLPDIGGSMNRVLARFGLPEHPLEAYNNMVGNGAWILTERAVGERRDLMESVYKAYREEYAAHTCDQTHPYDGIPELLEELGKRGLRLTVFSNKDDADVKAVINHYFPDKPFEILRGRLPGVALKPAPDGALLVAEELGLNPDEILYVGDTGTDMDCGHNAHMTTVGVTWGFRKREELIQHKACHIIDRPGELLGIIDQ